ncbi:GlsB/YeaQ/YmgE family stress response membrane protein [Ursidibacter maritimus]|uniref:GlsB/YeaQ/YmgE family stress response membrane protein n=1 Tax=Ursidibacter maritimus TaxID=1331689 RepID=A0A949T6J1_9PAST|nr:GlsB/YeaQ/YmgE family stress response membrane protein [Ursidibacter maritimus]KAE9539187.1 transglycosylase [Ursidibacter maritimus]MBV6523942.1 GlsB/YeaQ/YmgE family stress response membrane protein [Ursidibacter maritimus]MBV6525487.1 GlsB/YeaQ/YmgE family stress response membrane protein [Ursidibacter maritimus]MBV6526957.1 GlsB/YeaQ/YmgE family stress response membrane protein [Ursidibacter maritimus]MBV6530232.1 GlsB/YeaQ/YmgE family stress response membrane protein [Ursidibacter mari
MGWIAAIIVGALIGWIAEKVMKSDMGLFMNIVIGIIGSSLGRWVFGDLLGIGSAHAAGSLNVSGLLFGVLGASLLIFILRFFKIMKS